MSGVVPGEVPFVLALRRARGAGGRRALLRALAPREGKAVGPVLRRAQSGLPGRRRRGASDVRGREGDRRRGRALRRRRSRARSTSRPRAGGRRALPTCSARASRTSSRGRIRGTSTRPTTAGGRCSSAHGPSRASWASTARVVDAAARRRRRADFARSTLHTTAGPETVPSSLVRTALGLRSTWISVGVLRLDRPRAGRSSSGRPLASAGSLAGSPAPSLASSADGLAWARGRGAGAGRERRRRARRQAGSNHALPNRGEGERLAGGSRPGRAACPARAAGRAERPHRDRAAEARRGGGRRSNGGRDRAGSQSARRRPTGRRLPCSSSPRVPGAYRARILATGGFAEGMSPVLQVSG